MQAIQQLFFFLQFLVIKTLDPDPYSINPNPQHCKRHTVLESKKFGCTESTDPDRGAGVVVVVTLGPGRMSILGLQVRKGELERADQVRYMMYMEMREDCSRPELGMCS
jgi:hypothetical protein